MESLLGHRCLRDLFFDLYFGRSFFASNGVVCSSLHEFVSFGHVTFVCVDSQLRDGDIPRRSVSYRIDLVLVLGVWCALFWLPAEVYIGSFFLPVVRQLGHFVADLVRHAQILQYVLR